MQRSAEVTHYPKVRDIVTPNTTLARCGKGGCTGWLSRDGKLAFIYGGQKRKRVVHAYGQGLSFELYDSSSPDFWIVVHTTPVTNQSISTAITWLHR